MYDVQIGMIFMFGGNFAPRGWAFCDGQLLPINQNQALFSILGTTYGGDGRTTFGLPDLRGRVPIHPGTGPGLSPLDLGRKSGAENVTLTAQQIPSHNHALRHTSDIGLAIKDNPTQTGDAFGVVAHDGYFNMPPTKSSIATPVIENTGGGQPFDIHQPYQCVNFIIALQGLYPSRS